MTKVCVFGAGAVGSHMAAWLARGGLQVSMLARGASLAAINANGLRFESAQASFTVNPRASDDARALGEQDLVIVALKANALPGAAQAMLPLLGPRTAVVFAVNGIPWWYAPQELALLDPQRTLERTIGVERAIGCVVLSPNTLTAPGVVYSSAPVNRFLFGEPEGGISQRLRPWLEVLQPLLPGAEGTESIRSAIWSKLLMNVPESLLAMLTMSDAIDFMADPRIAALCDSLLIETAAVACAEGFDVDRDVALRRAQIGSVRHSPSMLQDLRKGRAVESDAQLHAVQALARRSGVATPLLDTLLPLLEQRVRTGRA